MHAYMSLGNQNSGLVGAAQLDGCGGRLISIVQVRFRSAVREMQHAF